MQRKSKQLFDYKMTLLSQMKRNSLFREDAKEVLKFLSQREQKLKLRKSKVSSPSPSGLVRGVLPHTEPILSSAGGERVISPRVRPHGTGVTPSTTLSLGLGSSSTPVTSTGPLKQAVPVNHEDPLSLKLGLPDHDPQPDVSLKLATPGL